MTRLVGFTRELLPGAGIEDDRGVLRAAGASEVREHWPATPAKALNLLSNLDAGDVVLVSEGARLATTVTEFTKTAASLTSRGIHLHVLSEPALTTGAACTDPGDVLIALSDLRHRLIGLRTRAGMMAAAAAGRRPGRPPVMTTERIEIARELRGQSRSYAQIARALGVSVSAVQRTLRTPTG